MSHSFHINSIQKEKGEVEGFDAFAFYSFIALTECRSKGSSSLVNAYSRAQDDKMRGAKRRKKRRIIRSSSRLNSVLIIGLGVFVSPSC